MKSENRYESDAAGEEFAGRKGKAHPGICLAAQRLGFARRSLLLSRFGWMLASASKQHYLALSIVFAAAGAA